MKFSVVLSVLSASAWQAESFVVGPKATKLVKSTALFGQSDWTLESSDFLNKIPEIPTTTNKPKPKEAEPEAPKPGPIPSATTPIGISSETAPSPAPEPVVAKPVESPKAVAAAPAPPVSSSIEAPDLPIPLLAGGALVAFAAATFAMRGDVDEREAAQSSPPPAAPSSAGGVDLSIPYHAAAQLAYEKSDKSMSYADFEKKYEADAVAEVKAKQKK